jgi:23S rRNA (guanosine2251-2'-O)-methyltransferase
MDHRKGTRSQGGGGRDDLALRLHAVRDALLNPAREKLRLVVTRNALDRLGEAVPSAGVEPEIADPRKFPRRSIPAPSTRAPRWRRGRSTGAAWRTWRWAKARRASCFSTGSRTRITWARSCARPRFSAPARWSPRPAIRHRKPARWPRPRAGALERQPYLRVPNLGNAIEALKSMGYLVIGLDGEGPIDIARAAADARGCPAALVLGAEGPGLRARTRELCDVLARIPAAGEFGSLNVSNAAAVSLYALRPD